MTTYKTPGVYIKEDPPGSRPIQGVSTAVAAFLGVTQRCPAEKLGRASLVTNWEQYKKTYGEFVDGVMTPLAVYSYFMNGGSIAYVMSMASIEGSSLPSQKATAQITGRDGAPSLELTSKGDAKNVKVVVEDQPDDTFKVTISADGVVKPEVYENLSLDAAAAEPKKPALKTLAASKLVTIKEVASAATPEQRKPIAKTYDLTAAIVAPIPTKVEIEGSLPKRVGMAALEALDNVTMICMPDLMEWVRTKKVSEIDAQGYIGKLIAHAENMNDRMVIIDAPAGLTAEEVLDWRARMKFDSAFATLYYPWISVSDPLKPGSILVPPSGHLAGIWARSDTERGVHKAPANEIVRGALGLEVEVTHGEQGELNEVGINCIRSFPGRGIRVWGARTLSSDTTWRYINVRRLFNFIEKSIYNGTQWVVFEPNDMDLWERVKRTVNAFLSITWQNGALFGATTDEAFFVKCDAELNPPEMRDLGILTVQVGIAPVKPAEFVVFRFRQVSGNASAE